MEVNEMMLADITARRAEISERQTAIEAQLDAAAGEELEALAAEAKGLSDELAAMEERENAIMAEAEARAAKVAEVINHGTESRAFKEDNTMSNMEVRNTKAYIDAYANYIKTNDDRECRALLTENVSGTVPVPELVYDIVKTAWQRDGIMSRVRKVYVQGNLKVGFEISATGATVHTEAANSAVTEETLTLGIVNLVPVSIKKWISISDEVRDMGGEAFLNYIYDELTYQVAKKAAAELIRKITACGTQSTTTCVGVPAITTASASMGLIAQAMALLSAEAADPVVIMNKATWGAFKAAQYAGQFNADPFEGLPVVFDDALPSITAATTGVAYAIVGDLGHGALANFPNGEEIEVKYDATTLMEKDLIRILARQYVAVEPVAPNAFVTIKK